MKTRNRLVLFAGALSAVLILSLFAILDVYRHGVNAIGNVAKGEADKFEQLVVLAGVPHAFARFSDEMFAGSSASQIQASRTRMDELGIRIEKALARLDGYMATQEERAALAVVDTAYRASLESWQSASRSLSAGDRESALQIRSTDTVPKLDVFEKQANRFVTIGERIAKTRIADAIDEQRTIEQALLVAAGLIAAAALAFTIWFARSVPPRSENAATRCLQDPAPVRHEG